MPDGGFFPQPNRIRRNADPPILQNPERGVVEIKPAEYDLDALTHEEQTLRYLRQYGLVLITNLREFRLLKLDGWRKRPNPRTLYARHYSSQHCGLPRLSPSRATGICCRTFSRV